MSTSTSPSCFCLYCPSFCTPTNNKKIITTSFVAAIILSSLVIISYTVRLPDKLSFLHDRRVTIGLIIGGVIACIPGIFAYFSNYQKPQIAPKMHTKDA